MDSINNSKLLIVGTREDVYKGLAQRTAGGLTKNDLFFTKRGRWVSKLKHKTAKKEKRLEKAGYKPKKGTFVAFKKK